MNKIFKQKYWWAFLIVILVVVNFLAAQFHGSIDLTKEKRFTLSNPTKKLLRDVKDKVRIQVFLDGDLPSGFRKLSNSTRDLLIEFRELSNNRVSAEFSRPGEGMDDTARLSFIQYIQDSLGLQPTNVKVTAKAGEGQEERTVYAGALVTYKDRQMPVNLLEGQSLEGGYQTLNNAEALLEYKFAHAIQKLTTETVPVIGYVIGNGEPLNYNVYDLIENTLKPNYGFSFLPIDSVPVIPEEFDALIVVKPTIAFTDRQKLKLDQFVMRGGRIMWMIDNLYAEMDSLMRTQSDFIAFDRGLNLEDQFFKYGVRINQDLLQDLQSDRMPLVVGSFGNQPQMQLVPWPYFPLLSSYSGHPIAKNLDNVLSIFPNSIDTIASPGIRKTILLASSDNSRTLNTPAMVSLNSVKTEADLKTFNRSHIPVAVLLEGKFPSLYANRVPRAYADSLNKVFGQPFRSESVEYAKMIVVSDADIVTNVFTQANGPLAMGFNQFTSTRHANRDFIINCIEYLTNPSGILETRAKDITLRLLDPKKIEQGRTGYQLLNIIVPVVLIILFGLIYHFLRKRRYER